MCFLHIVQNIIIVNVMITLGDNVGCSFRNHQLCSSFALKPNFFVIMLVLTPFPTAMSASRIDFAVNCMMTAAMRQWSSQHVVKHVRICSF